MIIREDELLDVFTIKWAYGMKWCYTNIEAEGIFDKMVIAHFIFSNIFYILALFSRNWTFS